MDITITLEVPDARAAADFYDTVFGLGDRLAVREGQSPTTGFRGFTVSLVVGGPRTVDGFLGRALDAGARAVKPAKKSLWGYGGVVEAPDGALWKVATSNKKDDGPDTRAFDQMVLLLGVDDVKASRQFYVDHGLAVGKSFGSKYVQFDTPSSPVGLGLYGRKALAKDAGVAVDGSGSHRIAIRGDGGDFVDPDGFRWEALDRSVK
jgi:predicted lactoylglutathione lyase